MEALRNQLENRLNAYKRQLEMSENSLVSHNWIVEVGAYTVGIDEENKTQLVNIEWPSQFTDHSVKQIVNECVFKDKDSNKIAPQPINYKEWYRRQVETLELTLSLI